ncbi:MAG: AAA family ATPase [Caldilineaceae bacterium]
MYDESSSPGDAAAEGCRRPHPHTAELTYTAIRRLLAGDHPDSVLVARDAAQQKVARSDYDEGFTSLPMLGPGAGPSAGDYAVYGEWAPTVKLLCDAYLAAEPLQGEPPPVPSGRGTEAVKRAYAALVLHDAALALLMTSDPAPKRTSWTIRELVDADFPPPQFLVPGLIPVGLTYMAGRPKAGKSFLALLIALAADSGGEVLGIQVPPTRVFYWALEDTPFRLADRIKKICGWRAEDHTTALPIGGDGVFATECAAFGEGGIADLRRLFEQGYKIVFVDTLSRALGSADQMDPAEMTKLLGALQRLASEHEAALVLVDHHRKSARTAIDTDPIDDILGSTAKGGVADCALGLYRRHNEDTATLKLVGRDFADSEIALRWNPERFTWSVLPPEEAAGLCGDGAGDDAEELTRDQQAIVDFIAAAGGATLAQLVAETGRNRGTLHRSLNRLCLRGLLRCIPGDQGFIYRIPEAVAPVASVACVAPVACVASAASDIAPVASDIASAASTHPEATPATTATEATTTPDEGGAA